MDILSIAIILFIILEVLNVITLYFNPGTQIGNGVGVFKAWEKSKEDEELHSFVKYLVYWVAGTKVIFIVLLIVVLLTGSYYTKLFSVVALILSILSFYWRLYPLIREIDRKEQIIPKGYSKGLGMMIGGFILIFTVALLINMVNS